MNIWTDWTQISPRYFFLRGTLFGVVAVLMIQYFLRKIKTIYKNRKEPKDCNICGFEFVGKCNCRDPKVMAVRKTDEYKRYIKEMFGDE